MQRPVGGADDGGDAAGLGAAHDFVPSRPQAFDERRRRGRVAIFDPGLGAVEGPDADLRRRVHAHFGDDLTYDCLVGSTQSENFTSDDPTLTGPRPVFFFAATCLDQHRERGTLHAFYDRFLADHKAFFERVVDPASPWIRIVEHRGLEAIAGVVRDLADGVSDPAEGAIGVIAR